MKKILIIISLMFCVLLSNAQNVQLVQTTHVKSSDYNFTLKQWGDWSEWKESNCIITVNFETSVMKIDNGYSDAFKFLKRLELNKGVDENDGDSWEESIFNCVDKDGKPCIISIKVYVSGVILVKIVYNNFSYAYQGEPIVF